MTGAPRHRSRTPKLLSRTRQRRPDEHLRCSGEVQTDQVGFTIELILMERLGTFSDSDGLSQLLLRLSVNSTLYCLSSMTVPWGFKVAARSGPAFHLLTSGCAWLEVEGQPEPVRVAAGDLVILPRGEAHVMKDSMRSPVLWLDRILAQTPVVNGRLDHG